MLTLEQRHQTLLQLNREVATFLGVEEKTFTINVNWSAVRANGQYSWKRNKSTGEVEHTIKISKFLVNEDEIRNTMLHELCHAYNTERDVHGPGWQALAKKVGVKFGTKITRVSSKQKSIEYKPIAKLTCKSCGRESLIYRKTRVYKTKGAGYFCRHCGLTAGPLQFTEIKEEKTEGGK